MEVFTVPHVFRASPCGITRTPCGLRAESELFRVIPHGLAGHQFGWSTCITVRVSPCGVRALKARTLGLPSDCPSDFFMCSDSDGLGLNLVRTDSVL